MLVDYLFNELVELDGDSKRAQVLTNHLADVLDDALQDVHESIDLSIVHVRDELVNQIDLWLHHGGFFFELPRQRVNNQVLVVLFLDFVVEL